MPQAFWSSKRHHLSFSGCQSYPIVTQMFWRDSDYLDVCRHFNMKRIIWMVQGKIHLSDVSVFQFWSSSLLKHKWISNKANVRKVGLRSNYRSADLNHYSCHNSTDNSLRIDMFNSLILLWHWMGYWVKAKQQISYWQGQSWEIINNDMYLHLSF